MDYCIEIISFHFLTTGFQGGDWEKGKSIKN